MFFASDNWAGVHPKIAAGLAAAADGHVPAYGTSDLDRQAERVISEVFDHDVAVFFVGTGTAANALALASVARPGGVAFAHEEAHVIADECGAPEFLSAGMRLVPVRGPEGRIEPQALAAAIDRFPDGAVHSGRPVAVTLTQATEVGTVYAVDEIMEIARIARGRGLAVHMDGARFANAVVATGATPAELTWKAGVDMLSFGGTKNGCWCAEAIVVFDPERAGDLPFLRKRSAQLFSKSRFIAAQFVSHLTDGLWLETADHANRMAARLATILESSAGVKLPWRSQANEVFAILPDSLATRLRDAGARFHPWPKPASFAGSIEPGSALHRFVTSFATTDDEIDRFADHLA